MSDILIIGQMVSVGLLIGIELMLWWQVRKLNSNFKTVHTKFDTMFNDLRPLITALNKTTPFIDMVNSISAFVRSRINKEK